MRGRVSDWKDDRGFGFIEPASGGERAFFHISVVVRGAPRPCVGDLVSYEMSVSPDGKARAVWVEPAGLAAVSNVLMSKRLALSRS
jgi:cold shock CspA family protein